MVDYAELIAIRSTIDNFYRSFTREKKDGDKRVITYPKRRLKSIQKRILRLFQYVQRPDWLISGERGKSYITNGKIHIDSDYLLTMDIKKFYNNCRREYVYRFFVRAVKTSPDVAAFLTDIVTLDGGIPTGCPTSQLIAYYAYEDMFVEINKIACKYNCIFTLYVDDMTFSSNVPFEPSKLKKEVDIILHRFGHRLKYRKVRYYSKGTYKPVTGVVISRHHTLLVPNSLQKKIINDTKEVKKLIASEKRIRSTELVTKIYTLRGRVQAARNLQSSIFPEVKQLADKAIHGF